MTMLTNGLHRADLGICRALVFLQHFCWLQSFYLCWLFECSSFSTFCSQPSLPSGCFLVSICACLNSVWWCLVSSAHTVVMVTFQACLHHPFSLTRHLSHTQILSMGLFLFLFYFTTLSCYNNKKQKIPKIYKYTVWSSTEQLGHWCHISILQCYSCYSSIAQLLGGYKIIIYEAFFSQVMG